MLAGSQSTEKEEVSAYAVLGAVSTVNLVISIFLKNKM